MGQTPDAVRAEIEGARADMSRTAEAISNRVSPRQAAQRQVRQVRNRLGGARDTIMGSLDQAAGSVQDMAGAGTDQAHGLIQGLQQSPRTATSQAQGNPLAAGLIAFGAGLLVASIIPASRPERQVAAKVGEAAQPAIDQAQHAAQEMKEHVQGAAQDALGKVQDTARGATEQVKQEASASAQDLAGSAREAAGEASAQARQ